MFSYAVSNANYVTGVAGCPCVSMSVQPPSFVGAQQFCDTGQTVGTIINVTALYTGNELFDGLSNGQCAPAADPAAFTVTLPAPTLDAATIEAAALDLLGRFDRERAVRLVGVRLEMAPPTEAEGASTPE